MKTFLTRYLVFVDKIGDVQQDNEEEHALKKEEDDQRDKEYIFLVFTSMTTKAHPGRFDPNENVVVSQDARFDGPLPLSRQTR